MNTESHTIFSDGFLESPQLIKHFCGTFSNGRDIKKNAHKHESLKRKTYHHQDKKTIKRNSLNILYIQNRNEINRLPPQSWPAPGTRSPQEREQEMHSVWGCLTCHTDLLLTNCNKGWTSALSITRTFQSSKDCNFMSKLWILIDKNLGAMEQDLLSLISQYFTTLEAAE